MPSRSTDSGVVVNQAVGELFRVITRLVSTSRDHMSLYMDNIAPTFVYFNPCCEGGEGAWVLHMHYTL